MISLYYWIGIIGLLCQNHIINCSWIDPDTDITSYEINSFHQTDKTYKLIFSDEFNVNQRQFHDGYDPKWTAIHKNDYTNYALHYYNQDLVTTNNGYLNISTIIDDITFNIPDPDHPGKETKMTKN